MKRIKKIATTLFSDVLGNFYLLAFLFVESFIFSSLFSFCFGFYSSIPDSSIYLVFVLLSICIFLLYKIFQSRSKVFGILYGPISLYALFFGIYSSIGIVSVRGLFFGFFNLLFWLFLFGVSLFLNSRNHVK